MKTLKTVQPTHTATPLVDILKEVYNTVIADEKNSRVLLKIYKALKQLNEIPPYNNPKFKDPNEAFEQAIKEGRLSRNPKAKNYAGHYMYMGPTEDGKNNAFKHIVTRQYIDVRTVA